MKNRVLISLYNNQSLRFSRVDALHFCVLQVAFHIQPYKGRTDQSMHDNIKYIINKWVVLSCLCLILFPFTKGLSSAFKTTALWHQRSGSEAWICYAKISGVAVKYRCFFCDLTPTDQQVTFVLTSAESNVCQREVDSVCLKKCDDIKLITRLKADFFTYMYCIR